MYCTVLYLRSDFEPDFGVDGCMTVEEVRRPRLAVARCEDLALARERFQRRAVDLVGVVSMGAQPRRHDAVSLNLRKGAFAICVMR